MSSEENLDFIRTLNCSVCGDISVEPHHVVSRGAGGGDSLTNLMPLCREHHIEIHKIGRSTFFKKYELAIGNHRYFHGLPELKFVRK